MPVQTGFVATIFGRARFGRVTGLINLFSIVGVFGLSPLIGLGYDKTGSYDLPLKLALGIVVLPALLVLLLRRDAPGRPVGETGETGATGEPGETAATTS